MHTDSVRINITLPKEIAESLKRMTGPRRRSRFIAEAIADRIERKEKETLELELEEGYRANRNEALAITAEFKAVDLEGWDEY